MGDVRQQVQSVVYYQLAVLVEYYKTSKMFQVTELVNIANRYTAIKKLN